MSPCTAPHSSEASISEKWGAYLSSQGSASELAIACSRMGSRTSSRARSKVTSPSLARRRSSWPTRSRDAPTASARFHLADPDLEWRTAEAHVEYCGCNPLDDAPRRAGKLRLGINKPSINLFCDSHRQWRMLPCETQEKIGVELEQLNISQSLNTEVIGTANHRPNAQERTAANISRLIRRLTEHPSVLLRSGCAPNGAHYHHVPDRDTEPRCTSQQQADDYSIRRTEPVMDKYNPVV